MLMNASSNGAMHLRFEREESGYLKFRQFDGKMPLTQIWDFPGQMVGLPRMDKPTLSERDICLQLPVILNVRESIAGRVSY